MSEPLTNALEQVAQPGEAKTIFDLIDRNATDLAAKLPATLEFDYFRQAVYSEIRRTPQLLDCDPYSLLGAVVQALQLGLSPGPLGHVYFLPFKREVAFVLGYKGIVELAFRSGHVRDVATGTVRDGDAFDYRYGTRPVLDHTPAGPDAERDATHYYAVVRLRSGGTEFRVIFPEDAEKARASSPGSKSEHSPWVHHYDAMARKTALRRLAPMLPQSAHFARALDVDESPAAPEVIEGVS